MAQAFRSAGAVLAGLLAVGIAIFILAFVLVWFFYGGSVPAPPTPAYVATYLSITLAAGVLGGWVTGRLGGPAPFWHSVGLAAVVAILPLGSATALGALAGGLWAARDERKRALRRQVDLPAT